jgi:hypothetical protein
MRERLDIMLRTVPAPLPPLTINISRPDTNSAVISIEGHNISLKHPQQKIGHISTTISTGGGFCQTGELREGVHVYEGGAALLNEYSIDGKKMWAPMFVSLYYNIEREIRPAGCAWVPVGKLLEAACSCKSLTVGGYLYASDEKNPINIVQVEVTPNPMSALTVQRWRDNEGNKIFNSLINRTFDHSYMNKELSDFAKQRMCALNGKFGAEYGNFDVTMSLYNIDMMHDTGMFVLKGCPKQRELFVKMFHEDENIALKHVLKLSQLQIEVISEFTVLSSGKHTINLNDIKQMLDAKEHCMTYDEAVKLSTIYTDTQTGHQDLRYRGDEHLVVKNNGEVSQDLKLTGEKEDLAGGLLNVHYAKNLMEWNRLNGEMVKLLSEKSRMGIDFKENDKIEQLNTQMINIRNDVQYLQGDCEDLAAIYTVQYAMAKDRPEFISKMTQEYLGYEIWPTSAENIPLLKELWPRMATLISTAMKMRERGDVPTPKKMNGSLSQRENYRQSYKHKVSTGICIANGASLQQRLANHSLHTKDVISRENYPSFGKFVGALCGTELGGHACTFQIECGPERELINDGLNIAHCYNATVHKHMVLEATKPCIQGQDMKISSAKIVDLNISLGDKEINLKQVPMDIAMNTIGQAYQNNINAYFKKNNTGLYCAVPMDISAASSFYSTFSSFDGDVCISVERRDDITGKVIPIETKNIDQVLDTQPENVRYVGAKLAWDAERGTESSKTEVLCVKFTPSQREMDIIYMACKEVGMIHKMSKEHLDGIMKMGIRIESGWNGDTYTSMRPDAPKRIDKMPLEILVRTTNGGLSAENVMKCTNNAEVKQQKVSVILHHISNVLNMNCTEANFRWINQDFGVIQNMMIDL